MKSLKDIIMLYHSISDESYEKLDQIMEVKEYKRKTELNNSNKFFILKKGFVRSSTFDEKGNRKTGNFLSESSIFTSIKPLPLNKKNSSLEIKFCCMSDVILYEGCFIKFLELTKTYHNLSLFYNRTLETGIKMIIDKVHMLAHLDATGRYLHLKSQFPGIENLIKLNEIASYINITPIQLSRIRKKLYSV